MRKNDGHAIAVYNLEDPERIGFKKGYQLSTRADRVRHIAEADSGAIAICACSSGKWSIKSQAVSWSNAVRRSDQTVRARNLEEVRLPA